MGEPDGWKQPFQRHRDAFEEKDMRKEGCTGLTPSETGNSLYRGGTRRSLTWSGIHQHFRGSDFKQFGYFYFPKHLHLSLIQVQ